MKTNKSTQNPKKFTFALYSLLSASALVSSLHCSVCPQPLSDSLLSASLKSQLRSPHLTSGIRYKIINIWAILFVKNLKITLFIWALPGLGVRFGPSIFFLVIDRICFVCVCVCVFFFFFVGGSY